VGSIYYGGESSVRGAGRPQAERKQQVQNPSWRGQMAGHVGRIDDSLLIREAQRGNRAAFEELVRHYDQAVLRLAMHLYRLGHRKPMTFIRSVPEGSTRTSAVFRFEVFRFFITWIYRHRHNLCPRSLAKKQECEKKDAPVAIDAEGEPVRKLLEPCADGRAAAKSERDLCAGN